MVRRVIQEIRYYNKALKHLEIGMSEPLESPSRIEPCWIENIPLEIGDLIADLTSASERLGSRLHPHTAANLADLVRVMYCYYSNLIEGHHTKHRGTSARILAMAAAHHRLNYIHPFPDGNGRVSRLMSHAIALQAGIGASGLWSVSRSLAPGLASRQEYKRMILKRAFVRK